jgi:Polyketide cyclase / dehydrase and lipid transport
MSAIKPVEVSIHVPHECAEVFDFLDVMANHEQFTDHMLLDWSYSGPPRGIGSKAQVSTKVAGRRDTIIIEVISAKRPRSIVERNVGAKGRRIGTGTYTLEPLSSGGTRIGFVYAWQSAPMSERLAAPLVRAYVKRGNAVSMRRLAELLDETLRSPA